MHNSLFISIFFLIFQTNSYTGKVIYVSDGDTFVLSTVTGNKIKVRVEGVDAPELTQQYGLEAKAFLMNEIHNKLVRLQVVDTDRYGRKVAKVIFNNGKELDKILISNGMAWHYKAYNKDQELATLELKAKKEKRGLWSKSNPIPPWEFRKKGHNKNSSNKINNLNNQLVFICSGSSSYSYHKNHCSALQKCKMGVTEISFENAKKTGRKACGICW